MLTAGARLRRSDEFAATIKGGRRAGRGALVVHFRTADDTDPARSGEQSPARAGFVVSKAVGGAVVRNTVKRRLRHLMRDRLAALPVGSAVVVRALPAAAGRDYAALGADLDAALAAATRPRARTSA